ncbi:hypothetical protein [Thiococcus pfennigii]|uniref:hypothetical protein n=1 Tax=Thiococcus pfennigii TaxID=1057 RepID=UPI001908559A|nr:hypothetical protein [Thiococcus pfennigii]
MSQVISIKVPEHYEEACVAFQKEMDLADVNGLNESAGQKFMVSYDKSAYEIQCEGDFPDSVFSALVMVKDQFGGKLFYEGEEWNEKDGEVVEEAGSLEKIWIILAIVFFPIALIYLLIRVVVWIPFKVWKATR